MRIIKKGFYPKLTQGELIKGSGNSEKLVIISIDGFPFS